MPRAVKSFAASPRSFQTRCSITSRGPRQNDIRQSKMTVSHQQDVCLVRNSLGDVHNHSWLLCLLALNYSLVKQASGSIYKPGSELTVKHTSLKLAFEDHYTGCSGNPVKAENICFSQDLWVKRGLFGEFLEETASLCWIQSCPLGDCVPSLTRAYRLATVRPHPTSSLLVRLRTQAVTLHLEELDSPDEASWDIWWSKISANWEQDRLIYGLKGSKFWENIFIYVLVTLCWAF